MNSFYINYSKIFKQVLVCLSIGLFTPLVTAQTLPSTTTIHNKPIAIDADNQQIDLQNNTITFSGNVIITQDGLKIKAKTVIIANMQSRDNQVITAQGNPVYFERVDPKNIKDTITGHANELVYQVKQDSVQLTGNAELYQLDNHIVSDQITYNIKQQKIWATADENRQVKTTIVPNQVSGGE